MGSEAIFCDPTNLIYPICRIAAKIPAPIAWVTLIFFACAGWLISKEWKILSSPANSAFRSKLAKLIIREPLSVGYLAVLRQFNQLGDIIFGPLPIAKNELLQGLFKCQPFTFSSFLKVLPYSFIYPPAIITLGVIASLENHTESPFLFMSFVAVASVHGYICASLVRRNKVLTVMTLGLIQLCVLVLLFDGLGISGLDVQSKLQAILQGDYTQSLYVCVFLVISILVFLMCIEVWAAALYMVSIFCIATIPVGAFFWPVALLICISIFHIDLGDRYVNAIFLVLILGCVVIVSSADRGSQIATIVTATLPLFNALLDWISLCITRGLLNRVAVKPHGWKNNLLISLCDVFIAVALFVFVAIASFLAIQAVNLHGSTTGVLEYSTGTIVKTPLLTMDNLVTTLSGRNELSVPAWLIFSTALIPTFIHFLIAILGLFTLPFTQKSKLKIQLRLQSARREAISRVRRDSNQAADAVTVDEYARRGAMIFTLITWPVIIFFWLICIVLITYMSMAATSKLIYLI